MNELNYFDTIHAIAVHDKIIEVSGGAKNILNLGLIDSVLEHIKNDIYYPNFEDKLTHLFFSINKNHGFNDEKKRSSIALTAYFMEINGFDFRVNKFIVETENIAVDVADNRIGKELLGEMISSLLYEKDYSEELKLKIVQAKNSNHIF